MCLQKREQGSKGTNWAIFLLCFSAVFREGIEAVVFLAGVSTTESVTAIPIAAVVGIICGLACGFILFFTCVPASSHLASWVSRPLPAIFPAPEASSFRLVASDGKNVCLMTAKRSSQPWTG